MTYSEFLLDLDKRLSQYFENYKNYTYCCSGCSFCCENGDYPISQLELEFLMQGFIALENDEKRKIQINIKNMEKGKACPFLIDKRCSVYKYRPIICRVHGLAYLCKEKTVKLPYCVKNGKNFANVFKNGEIFIEPIKENLDTPNLLRALPYGEIRNLYDWLKLTN